MHFFGMEASSVQLRVGAPVLRPYASGGSAQAPQSSQRSGRFHTPAVPRAALGTATSLRSPSFGLAGHLRLLAEALPTSSVRKSRRGGTGGRLPPLNWGFGEPGDLSGSAAMRRRFPYFQNPISPSSF